MTLEELYYAEIYNTSKRILNKYIPKIEEATPQARSKAKQYYINELLKEFQGLFIQKDDPKDEYHFIENFYGKYFSPVQGLRNSIDNEVNEARKLLLKDYHGHEYNPHIKKFLKQSNEIIVKKMATYNGYQKAIEVLKKRSFEVEDADHLDGNISIDEKFISIFKDDNAFDKSTSIIEESYLNKEEKYIELNRRKAFASEIVALAKILYEKKYFKPEIEKPDAAMIIGAKYSISMELRTTRHENGKAFDEATEEFNNEFPDLSTKKPNF